MDIQIYIFPKGCNENRIVDLAHNNMNASLFPFSTFFLNSANDFATIFRVVHTTLVLGVREIDFGVISKAIPSN